ncbi:MAG: hypothetical protein GY715_14155 [Planctomycetes bacterium]|nr:hypothetical protein [Planctomycetota bacterium]
MLDILFATDALLFTVPALLGTAVFLMKTGLMLLGGAVDADVEMDVDADADVPEGVHDPGDSTDAFTFISMQSIAAFLMGFGWGGLVGFRTLEWSLVNSLLLGVGFGVFLMWLLGIMLRAVYDLQGSGHVSIESAIGRDGTVYAEIPGSDAGAGQVRVVIDERERFYRAVSVDEKLPTGTRIRVVRVTGDNTLTVRKV